MKVKTDYEGCGDVVLDNGGILLGWCQCAYLNHKGTWRVIDD